MRVLAGAFGGTVGSVCLAIVGDVVPIERRGRAMGILMTAFSVATVFGLPLGLAVAAHAGWHWVFLSIALVGVALFFFAKRTVPSLAGHLSAKPESKWEEMRGILSSKNCLNGLVFSGLVVAAGFLIIPFLSPSLVTNVGVLETQLSLVYFVGGICTFFSSPLVGRASDRWGHVKVFSFMAVLSCVPFLAITQLPAIPLWQVLFCTTFFMVVSGGRMVPTMAILTAVVPSERRGSYMSLATFFQQLCMGIASLIAGKIILSDASGRLVHFERAGYLAVAVTLLSLWMVRRLKAVVHSQTHHKPTVAIESGDVREVI
jgi:predicted MFS family arabinose efflux permease